MPKNYLKKTLAGIFAVAIVASSIPLAPYTKVLDSISITASAISSEVDSWSGLQTAIDEAEAGVETPIALAQNITASDGDTFIAIPAGKVITLDLNGYTLDRGLSTAAKDGYVIRNNGTLTICDGSEKQTGKITGGKCSASCGGIYNNLNSTLTINGGSITGNTSSTGGGIYNYVGTLTINGGNITGNTAQSQGGGICNVKSTLTINGGNISGNTAQSQGGGICNIQESTLTITGGNISGNTAKSHGGGIYNGNGGTLTIIGGYITGNSSATYGGGIITYTSGNITVGGSAIINGNLSTHSSDGIEESNIHLNVDAGGTLAKLQISETTPLTNSASIGITVWLASGWDENTDISTFIDGLTADNAKQIFATNCGTANRGAIYYITAEDGKFVTTTEKPAAGNTIPNSTLTWEIDENGVLTISGDDEAFPECWVNDAAVEWCDKKDEVKEVVFNTPNMTKLGSAAFYEFPMAKITLPDTLTEIGYAAFKHCAQLESLDIPNGVKEIPVSLLEMEQDESNNWASITSLTSISMASDVTKIDGWAFANCTSVQSFDGLADSLKGLISLGEGALMGISISDILIYIPETLDQTSIDRFTFNGANLGTDLEIPSFITELGENAFGWANLEHVIIPASVSKIDKNAFIGWGNLKTITLLGAADSVAIDDEAFSGNNVDWNTMTFYVPVSQVDAYKSMKALEGSNVIGQATATFDLGGKGDNFTLDTDDEVKITEPTAPTADGYVFGGWYTDKDCTDGNLFDFSTQITDDITLYAKWTEQHTVTFDMQNHGTVISPITVNSGDKITEPDAPSETGYVFGGWFTDEACTESNQFDFDNTAITDDIILYAKWEETATVTFDMQGHGTQIAPITVKSGDKIEEPTVQNEDGYIFCGWGYNAAYDLPFDFSNEIIDDTVIYARWCPISSACGDNLMYKFDEASGEVTIYGDGTEMDDYSSKWPDYYGLPIKSIRFETENLTTIGKFAFSCLSDVTDITIPASVTTINDYAFENCESLSMLTFEGDSVPVFSENGVFKNCKPDVIYVPAGCLDAYKAVLVDYADQIQEIPTAEAKGYSVSYNGDITINFHYLVSDSYKNGYVKFSDGTKVSASDAFKDANGYFVFPISMPAKNMYDEITAQFYDENDVAIGNAVTFKMADYLSAVKDVAPNTACADFVDSFLEYGAQAAAYFGVTGAPAGKTYSDSDFASISNTLEANYASTDNMGDTFVGATLLLKSTPKLRLYYSETFTGAEQNELNKNLFYTEKEISPVKFGTEDLNGYYVYNYIYKAMNSDDSVLKVLCAALYNMSEAIPAVG